MGTCVIGNRVNTWNVVGADKRNNKSGQCRKKQDTKNSYGDTVTMGKCCESAPAVVGVGRDAIGNVFQARGITMSIGYRGGLRR